MSVPENTGSDTNPSLFASLRSFWSVLLAVLYTRLDLATVELEDEAVRAIKLLVAGLVSILALAGAVFFGMFFILALFWDNRLIVLAIIFGFYLIVGLILFFVARNMVLTRPKFLSQTLTELRRDVEGLRPPAKTGKSAS
jgi:uncharacterized membrane protein YqjE